MENKIIIICKSSTGFTKKYASLISRKTGARLVDFKEASPELMSGCDLVIFGSRAHAGRIDGYKKIRDMFHKSTARRFLLFVTGATPAAASGTINEFWAQNLTEEELADIPHFYMPGGLCYEKMSLSDRLMMKVAAKMMKKKKNKTAQDLEFQRAISSSYDISDKAYAEPLIAFLSSIRES